MICVCQCGWRGVPTYTGGERTLLGYDEHIGGPVFKVAGAQRSKLCPACKGKRRLKAVS